MSCAIVEKRSVAQDISNTVSCLGSDKSNLGVIYLHGMDTATPSDQEKQNRNILQNISDKYNLRIAIPRSNKACSQNKDQICWGWNFNDIELSYVRNEIEKSSSICKLPSKRILIGFSNGAYALNKLFRQCLTSNDQVIISQGANIYNGSLEIDPKDLSKCGHLIFISGLNDKYNFDPSLNYIKQLKSKNSNVDLITFDGGHEMNEEAVSKAIKEIL